ncbi:MAG: methyl-accepting chemotaxis protein [Sneathiellales bacterium]|nr:methyl-accepting chemotaxis protein [Sneathiellales bacterium]
MNLFRNLKSKRPDVKSGSQLTVSRKILLVVLVTFLVGTASLVFIGNEKARTDLTELAIDTNLTISNLLAEQISGGLRWKKTAKIEEVYAEMVQVDDPLLTNVITFDRNGKKVTEYISQTRPFPELLNHIEAQKESFLGDFVFNEVVGNHQVITTPVITAKGKTVGHAVFSWSLGRLEGQLQSNLLIQTLIGLAVLAGSIIFTAYLLRRFITRPLSQLTQAMTGLAGGDVSLTVTGIKRKDDVGDMSRAVQVFKENALKVKELQVEQEKEAQAKAEREASRAAQEEERKEKERFSKLEAETAASEERALILVELAQKLEESVDGVAQEIANSTAGMEKQARTMLDGAGETAAHSQSIANASENAARNVGSVASATEELSASLQEINRQISVSNDLSKKTLKDTEETDEVVGNLASSAEEIGNVVSLINDIAEQTNLLALNATIEAARAGDAGKGFAVVASEVKGLASQTTKATEEIAKQIDNMQAVTTRAVDAVQGIKTMIIKINESVAVIASSLEEQNEATQEITRNVQMASERTGEVSKDVAEVSSMATVSGSTANDLLSSAGELTGHSDKLKTEVETVLRDIRAMV